MYALFWGETARLLRRSLAGSSGGGKPSMRDFKNDVIRSKT